MMKNPAVAGKPQPYSASNALAAIGQALGEIKMQDRLTWGDVGAVLGVSDDQAAKYADGTATMNFVTFGRGKREWGSRFTGYFDRLCGQGAAAVEDRRCESAVLRAALTLSQALADDENIDREEVRRGRSELEQARDAIDVQLGKLRPAA